MKTFVVPGLAACLMLSGCATSGSAMERAWQQCGVAVVGGAIIGGIIGNNTGNGDAQQGMTTGLLTGGGICAVLLAMASEEDKRRIREAEYAALETGEVREDSYIGEDGKRRTIVVRTQDAPAKTWSVPAAEDGKEAETASMTDICRYRQTTLSVESTGSGSLDAELVCRNPQTREWEVQRA